jgi:Peptidylarginine deiminase and related enzymes
MTTLNPKTPAQLGFQMPAEWSPHAATWLTWPKDPETWPDRVEQVQEIYLEMLGTNTPRKGESTC